MSTEERTEAREQLKPGYYENLYEIQTLDFTLLELDLYLDTHPYDTKAIKQYNQYAQRRKQLVNEFEAKYGPLMHGSYSRVPWEWSTTPWPWQI